jgi:hypothetical protein
MSSERAGVHANVDAVLDAIRECAAPGMELRYDGTEDPVAAAYVAGVQTAYEAAKGALEACVVPDPRLARIEAMLTDEATEMQGGWIDRIRILSALRGDE